MIFYNLRDNEDITARVAAATASMGALKEVWQNQYLNIYLFIGEFAPQRKLTL